MPVSPTYPGIYVEEIPSSSRTITAAPTSIATFVGYVHPFQGECASQQDPKKARWGEAIRIFSFTDFERIFGGLYNNAVLGQSDVGYALNQFFLNGGSEAYVVGLKPQYHDTTSTKTEEIAGATLPLSRIDFTARQLTDDDSPVTVTIRNVRASQPAGPKDTADLVIAYRSQVEPYRGVQLSAVQNANHIANRLKSSQLVTIAPTGGGPYPLKFDIGAAQAASIELTAMPAPSFAVPPRFDNFTTFNAQDFSDVFKYDGHLDKVDIFNILVLPGVYDVGVWSNALAFCERKRAFFIMDAPPMLSADGFGGMPETIENFVTSPAMPIGKNGALYYPYLKTLDPVTDKRIFLPPSGSVAGIYARIDTSRGVWKAPAGIETSILNTTGVVDLGRMTDLKQGVLNNLGVNVLRSLPGSGTVVWGARTTVTQNLLQWRYVPVRRTALFIEQSLVRNLAWVVFEPNDEPLWAAIRLSIEGFMLSLFRQAAFQGSTPSEAFLVKCDATTTRDVDIQNGIVNIVVGFRALKPAEFVIIKIAQLAGQVQV
jgi:phage tail sheath protein FI